MATRAAQPTRSQTAAWELAAFLRHLDYLLLLATGALIAYGLWVLEAVTRSDVPGDPDYYVFRQGVYIAVGVVLLAVVTAVDPEVYRRLRVPLYALAVVLLVAVFVLAEEVRGSKRWIEIGFFNFQPSELGKVVLVVVLAGFVAERRHRMDEWRTTLGVVGLTVPLVLLVFKEPDFGSSLVYAAVAAAALFFGGTPWRHLAVLAVIAALVAGALLWFLPSAGVDVLEPYQRERLIGFVHPDVDPSGSTYNVTQSLTAVGAGGLDGRGVANATQTKFNYLPEHSTDFIFSSLAEVARLPRRLDPAPAVRDHRLAGHQDHRRRARSVLGGRGGDDRLRAPRPALHQHRHDDRDRARDRASRFRSSRTAAARS